MHAQTALRGVLWVFLNISRKLKKPPSNEETYSKILPVLSTYSAPALQQQAREHAVVSWGCLNP